MQSAIILHYHEIALKGRNRAMFEQQLIDNVRWALRAVRGAEVKRMSGRIVVRCEDDVQRCGGSARIVDALGKVFGIQNILIGFEVRQEWERLVEDVLSVTRQAIEHEQPRTFAVRAKRAQKQYVRNSLEIERELGASIVATANLNVDLDHPDLTVYVEIVERTAFVFTEKMRGPGGLPVGSAGRVLCLLSSGFDSPVAAWKLMRRGCVVDFVHFHSYPYTSDVSMRNVEELSDILEEWQQQRGVLTQVALIEYQKEVMTSAPAALRVLLYRRMMYRIAERIARASGCAGLVTGESVGQVASQTIANLAAVGAVVSIPVFRPLIGEDKQDIIAHAERIGTAEISKRPYDDCCSLFTPDHPATRSTPELLHEVERDLDVDRWAERLTVDVLR